MLGTVREDGRQEEKFRFARKLLAQGNSIEDTAEMTELAVEEVRNLQH